jgi:hypothetical protein
MSLTVAEARAKLDALFGFYKTGAKRSALQVFERAVIDEALANVELGSSCHDCKCEVTIEGPLLCQDCAERRGNEGMDLIDQRTFDDWERS